MMIEWKITQNIINKITADLNVSLTEHIAALRFGVPSLSVPPAWGKNLWKPKMHWPKIIITINYN